MVEVIMDSKSTHKLVALLGKFVPLVGIAQDALLGAPGDRCFARELLHCMEVLHVFTQGVHDVQTATPSAPDIYFEKQTRCTLMSV